MEHRTIVVGDVHGCLRELEALLARVGLRGGDRLWFLGDLVNRGPDSGAVVRLARQLGAGLVQGNHDHAQVAWGRFRSAEGAGDEPPRRPSARFLAVHASLGDDDLAWLAAAPTVVQLGPGLVLVHGGLRPGRPLDDQPSARDLRYLDRRTGREVTIAARDAAPGEVVHWSELWEGPWQVIYGHHAQPEVVARLLSLGIDTGAVYGGKLTAAVLEPDRDPAAPSLVQVPAARAYFP